MSTADETADTDAGGTDESLQDLTLEERTEIANARVRQYAFGGMAVGLVPVPLFDLAALFSVQVKMQHSLARIFNIEFRADLGRSAIASLVAGTLPLVAAPTVAASLGKLIPGFGQTFAVGSQAVLSGAMTYALGKVFIQHFASGGTFLTFDPQAVKEYFIEQFHDGKGIAEAMKKTDGR